MPPSKDGTEPTARGDAPGEEQRRLLEDARAVGRVPVTDHGAFRRIYDAYSGRLRGRLGQHRHRGADPEDLLQDTFLRVYRKEKPASFATLAAFEGWLFTAAENVARNQHRNEGTQKNGPATQSLDFVTEQLWTPPTSGAIWMSDPKSALDQMLDAERRAKLETALAGLPPKMQECARLYYMQGLKQRQIATIMRISIGTVKSHLYQAGQRLGEEFAEPSNDDEPRREQE